MTTNKFYLIIKDQYFSQKHKYHNIPIILHKKKILYSILINNDYLILMKYNIYNVMKNIMCVILMV